MLIIPAIDILDGKVVRLYQGDYDKVSVYSEDPVETAKRLASYGIKRLHLVDLDAARGQGKNNRPLLGKIRAAVPCEIELGGGIRARSDVKELVGLGIDLLIVGTALVKDTEEVASWIDDYPGRFIAGIDARDGQVKISGWESGGGLRDEEAGLLAAKLGFSAIVYTNIGKDGTLSGPDLASTERMARTSGLPLIVSGGVGTMEHVRQAVKTASPGILGIITGKAWYEEAIDLAALGREFPQA